MTKRKGAALIAEFLVNERIPYVFGLCGHGNVGLLDELYNVADKVKYVSPLLSFFKERGKRSELLTINDRVID